MRKTNIKKFAACTLVIALLGTCGAIKICRDKSKDFADNTIRFTNEFVDDNFLVAAHRGFSSLAVENSDEAFSLANDAAYVDYIELDVRLTDDDNLVCAHNKEVVTSSLDKIPVNEVSLGNASGFRYFNFDIEQYINSLFSTTDGSIIRKRSIALFGDNYSLIDLSEALNICDNKKILLDLKFDKNFDKFVEILMEEIKDIDAARLILQSADLESLKKLQEMFPEYTYSAIVNDENDFLDCASFQMLGIRKNLVGSDYVTEALANGKHLSIWTINTTKELETVTELLGDDYQDVVYITDYPDVIASHLNTIEMQKKKVTIQ